MNNTFNIFTFLCQHNNILFRFLEKFIKYGSIDVNQELHLPESKCTPLSYAARYKNIKMMQLLNQYGYNWKNAIKDYRLLGMFNCIMFRNCDSPISSSPVDFLKYVWNQIKLIDDYKVNKLSCNN